MLKPHGSLSLEVRLPKAAGEVQEPPSGACIGTVQTPPNGLNSRVRLP